MKKFTWVKNLSLLSLKNRSSNFDILKKLWICLIFCNHICLQCPSIVKYVTNSSGGFTQKKKIVFQNLCTCHQKKKTITAIFLKLGAEIFGIIFTQRSKLAWSTQQASSMHLRQKPTLPGHVEYSHCLGPDLNGLLTRRNF